MTRGRARTATLEGWESVPFVGGATTRSVLQKGSGPGVVVIPEVPGPTPQVLGFGEHLVDAGFTVWVPVLFGEPGEAKTPVNAAVRLAQLCVASEMRAFAVRAERPMTAFLRDLCTELAGRPDGTGRVGVVGMCFTGGFALATAVEPHVHVAVASQPGVPFAVGRARSRDIGLSPSETSVLQQRAADRGPDGVCLAALRFTGDRAVPGARFEQLRRTFGDDVELVELDSSRGNPDGYSPLAHSVLTDEARPGTSARDAVDRVIALMREKLVP